MSRLVVPEFADGCIVDLMTRENALERVVIVAADPDAGALLAELQRYVPDWTSSQPAAQALQARKTLVIPEVTEDTLISTARDERGAGRGSEFTVRLPVLAEAQQARGRAVEAAPGTARKRILLVEDNDDNREMTCILLEMSGHQVYEAADGRYAVELAVQLEPDVVLIDIGLPGIDGYEVAKQIRSKLRDRSRLIALSGYGQQKDRQQAFEAGFDEHLLKPVDPKRLLAVLVEARPPARS